MIKFFVRTTGQRDLSNYRFLEYTPMYDYNCNPIGSFIEQLNLISSCDAIMLEDDLVFSKDFLCDVQEVINKHPNDVINFYYMYLKFMPTMKIKGKHFLNNQCVYYPKGVAKRIAEEMQKILDEGCDEIQYDRIQAKAMERLGIDFVSYRPMLVQHIGGCNSLLGNKWLSEGKTIFFKDDLPCDYDDFKSMLDYAYSKYDELGIDYHRPKIIHKQKRPN